jgi:DNA polymerase-3 subunit epsilon
MAEVALADGVVTCQERADLDKVASYLGLRSTDVDAALSDAVQVITSRPAAIMLSAIGIELRPGDRVVFTGEMKRARSDWEEACRMVGLEVGTVTKSTRVVVASDPNSMSGKAAKARQYGIPIITEAAFERLLLAQAPVMV